MRVSLDTTVQADAQHATEVEPALAAHGTTLVSVFQVGRFYDGGSAAIGFATSRDSGQHWRSGLLPAITSATSRAGPWGRASDATVAYDERHARWLAVSLAAGNGQSALLVSASRDGLSWAGPVTAARYPVDQRDGTSLDKEWLACDNSRASRFRGRCYLAYTDLAHGALEGGVQSSSDGGKTWSPPVLFPVRAEVDGPGLQPVVQPSGELVIVLFENGVVEAVRSSDGGASFGARELVASLIYHDHRPRRQSLRAVPLPTTGVDSAGTVYVAWFDCRFRAGCAANDILLSHSSSPGSWSAPTRIPLGHRDYLLPALGVDPAGHGRLALAYYSLNAGSCAPENCLLDAGFVTSSTGGAHWSKPWRLARRSMRLSWLAETTLGAMSGDYFAAAFAGPRVVTVYVLAAPPANGSFAESVYAFSVRVR